MRRGLGAGKGTGYFNLIHRDSFIHSLSARGVKTSQGYQKINSMILSPATVRNYEIDPEKLLDSKYRWGKGDNVRRFMFNPDSKIFMIDENNFHSVTLANYKKQTGDESKFDDWLRGIYIKDKKKIYLRPFWQPKTPYDTFDAEAFDKSWEVQERFINNLKKHSDIDIKMVEFNANNDMLADLEGVRRW